MLPIQKMLLSASRRACGCVCVHPCACVSVRLWLCVRQREWDNACHPSPPKLSPNQFPCASQMIKNLKIRSWGESGLRTFFRPMTSSFWIGKIKNFFWKKERFFWQFENQKLVSRKPATRDPEKVIGRVFKIWSSLVLPPKNVPTLK